MACGATASCANLVNPSFEEGVKGWIMPPNNYSVVDGVGRGGSKGLVCERNDTNKYEWAYLDLPFRPGQSFDVSVWARNESPSDNNEVCCVEFYGGEEARFRYYGAASMKLDAYQPKDAREWRRYTVRIGPVEPEVKHCRLTVHIRTGRTGRVVFDDVEMEVIGTEPRGMLFSDRSDDRAYDGDVRFVAKSYANLTRIDGKDVEGFFTIEREEGKKERVEPDFFKDGRAEVVVNVSRLASGTRPVAFTVRDKKNGHVLDEMRMSFTRLSAPETAVSMFDGKRRLVVNGRPAYPLAIYVGDWDRDDPRFIPAIKRSPIKTVVCYVKDKPMRADLDFFHTNGIRVVATLSRFWTERGAACCREINAPDECNALTIRTVNELKNHPALLGWYLYDEPETRLLPRIRERYKVVRALDPEHFCLNVVSSVWAMHDAAATCDVIGHDCYPIPGFGTEQTRPADLGKVGREIAESRAALHDGKPLWVVPQVYVNDKLCGGCRFPTQHELRSMTWQGIACGADGVLFYAICEMLSKAIAGWFPFEESWDIVCNVTQEIKDHEAFLISDETPPVIDGLAKGIAARAWRKDGRILLVACNMTLKKIDATLSVDGRTLPISLGRHDVAITIINHKGE